MRKTLEPAFFVAAVLLSGCGGGSPATAPTPVSPSPPTPAATARYSVVFDATWREDTHPTDFPDDPHFSPLIGGTHSPEAQFWAPGGIASDGIEAMAEEGGTSPLDAEVQVAIKAGTAFSLIQGSGIPRSPGTVTAEFEIARDHPRVTLVSMIAPSPDWFVGVSGLSLFEDGDWVREKAVSLSPWDAGTDNGTTYSSRNRDARPPLPIARLEGAPVASGGAVAPFGTFTFRRIR